MLNSLIVDITSPAISSFSVPSTTTSLTVPISSFNANDNNGVTGYLVKESSNTPGATDSGWASTAPGSYTVSGTGTKTLYAWVKDAAGNISGRAQSQVSVTLPDSSTPGDDVEYVTICEGEEYFGLTKSGEYKRTSAASANNFFILSITGTDRFSKRFNFSMTFVHSR